MTFDFPFEQDRSTPCSEPTDSDRWIREWAMLGIFDLEELLARRADFDEQLYRELPDLDVD